MSINMNTWASNLIARPEKPFFPLVTYPGLEIINKRIIDMVSSGDVQFECIKALAMRYPKMPAIPMSMDLSLEAEAFGAKVKFGDNEVPTIATRLLNDYSEIETLIIPAPKTQRLIEFIKAAKLATHANFGKPVFTGCIGPFSLAGRLLDITEIMTGLFLYPDEVQMLLEKVTIFLLNYLTELKATGVNGVIMAEPAAGLLHEDQCDEFSSKYIKQLVDQLQDDSFMVMLHNCGNTETLVKSMVSTGAKAFHFGNAVDMATILPQVPSDRLVFGNLDPANLIKTASPDIILSEVQKLKTRTVGYPNFVLSSGCDIPPGTPLENIDALF